MVMRMKHTIKIFLAISIIAASIAVTHTSRRAAVVENVVTAPQGLRVSRTIDGDTFEVTIDGAQEKVRILGIDTPESVDPRKPVQCFAHEASDKLKEILTGKDIVLMADATNSDRDKYGRLLRYVTLAADGTSVNAEMIQLGYARAYTKFPFTHRAEYLKLQTEARLAGRGLWSPTTCRGRR